MKFRFLCLTALISTQLTAQSPDSVFIRQVDSLIKASRDLTAEKEFDKALEVNSAAEIIALEKLGRESVAYADASFNRGRVNFYKGNYLDAEKWYQESGVIREKVLGREHPSFARVLSNLGLLYIEMQKYSKAEQLFLESKAILEKTLGKEHPDYAVSLYHLANLNTNMGNYSKAEQLFLESRAILEKAVGREHRYYAAILNSLAVIYSKMGNYGKAEPLFLEAKEIREEAVGREHPDYANNLTNLAVFYLEMGNYEKAEVLFLEAKKIKLKALGLEHPDYVRDLFNLASLYLVMGSYEKAEPLFLEASIIQENVLGKEHPNYVSNLNNLGLLYYKMGNYEKAEPLFLEAKEIREKALGPEYLKDFITLHNLALLYHDMGNYNKAEQHYLESKSIVDKTLGQEHPAFTTILYNLIRLYEDMGQYGEAEPLLLELSLLNRQLIIKAHRHLSEKELNKYLSTFSDSQHQALSFTHKTNSKKTTSVCFDNSLFYKGFLLNSVNQVRRLANFNPATTDNFNLLNSYGRRLASEFSRPIAERDSTLVAELEEKTNALEKELVSSLAGYGEAMKQVNWQNVQQELKTGEVALEFVHYPVWNRGQIDSTMYAALLLKPGTKQPEFIPLFEEKQLDSLLQSSGDRKADYVNSLYTLADRGAAIIEGSQKSLYELIWQPLERELQEVQTIYFSPAGLLHRLNLGAIPISEEQTVADHFKLVALGSTRQMVIPSKVNPWLNDALLFGGVQYEADSAFLAQAKQTATNGDLAGRGGLSFTNSDSTLRGGNWNYLKWTDKEVSGLYSILTGHEFQITLRRGLSATEEEFKTIGQGKPSPRVLHLATHGFFFPDPKQAASVRIGLGESEPVFKMSDHPMIRSGLILAGGNHAWKQGKPAREGMEDGILTAYEISQMNLSNTELVVLSACETGLGDIQGHEGVYGLQRAFKIAGAKYLVMSLWQVPDQETSVFMTTFYKHWLEAEGPDKGGSKMTIPDAFRKTQQEMRERFINPYQWAGFVLVE